MVTRRTFLAVPVLSACTRPGSSGFRGYAFVANQEGQAVAAVDLQAMAVARHIALDSAPSQVVAARARPSVFALTPATGSVHEIQAGRLSFTRKLAVASTAVSMQMAEDERALYVLASQPRSLVRVALDSLRAEWRIALPEDPVDFALAPDGKNAAVSSSSTVRLIDLTARRLSGPLAATGPARPSIYERNWPFPTGPGSVVAASDSGGMGGFGAVRFLSDGSALIAANRAERRLSLYDVASARLIAHLPLSVRPDNLCFNADGGQLFVTGEGMDAVVIVYPYHMPEVAETVLAGHAPGAMAASDAFLFIVSSQSGSVSIMEVATRKVIAVVSVGRDPGFIAITPDDQYALVLNRESGDVAVLRIGTITKNRNRFAALLTVIPVGSRPVSAAVRGV